MPLKVDPVFVDSPSIQGRGDKYVCITVFADKVLTSWRQSLFAHEWIASDGRLKGAAELSQAESAKRKDIETRLSRGEPLEKPVMGIGMLDNIEIGTGRSVFLTLAALGVKEIPVHIPRSHEDEFEAFVARRKEDM